jgi:HEAT repeat protein
VDALLGDQSAAVRETSAWALGELQVRATTVALGQALADKEEHVRATAAWALGQIDLRRAPAALVKAMRDGDEGVRLAASWAISQIADPGAAPAVSQAMKTETDDQVRQAQVRALLKPGKPAADAIEGLLHSKDAKTRELAVRALSGRSGPWPWPWPQPRPRPFP